MAMWGTEGVLEAMHATPFGELPGSVVVTFATIDAVAHAWDLSSSVGRAIEFEPRAIAVDLGDRRGGVHRRRTGDGPDQGGHRTPGRRDRHRTADGCRGPNHPPLAAREGAAMGASNRVVSARSEIAAGLVLTDDPWPDRMTVITQAADDLRRRLHPSTVLAVGRPAPHAPGRSRLRRGAPEVDRTRRRHRG